MRNFFAYCYYYFFLSVGKNIVSLFRKCTSLLIILRSWTEVLLALCVSLFFLNLFSAGFDGDIQSNRGRECRRQEVLGS